MWSNAVLAGDTAQRVVPNQPKPVIPLPHEPSDSAELQGRQEMNQHTVELAHSKAWNLPLLQVESINGKEDEEKRQVNPTLKPLPVALCMIDTATFAVEAKEEEGREPKPQHVQAQLEECEYLSRRSHEGGQRVGRVVPVIGVEIGIGGHYGEGRDAVRR